MVIMELLIEVGFSIAVTFVCAFVFGWFVFRKEDGLGNCNWVCERNDGFVRKFDEDEVFGEVEERFGKNCDCVDKVFDKSPERGCMKEGFVEESFGENCGVSDIADKVFDESLERMVCGEIGEIRKELVEDDDDDDWERIESSELEKLFCSAVIFVGSRSNADRIMNLSSDVKMKLYGLQKIATEGVGYESQPMALKISARAKWNAWQQLGEMSSEAAMEQYISLFWKCIPGWRSADFEASGKLGSDLKTSSQHHSCAVDESCLSSRKPVKLTHRLFDGFDSTGVGDHSP